MRQIAAEEQQQANLQSFENFNQALDGLIDLLPGKVIDLNLGMNLEVALNWSNFQYKLSKDMRAFKQKFDAHQDVLLNGYSTNKQELNENADIFLDLEYLAVQYYVATLDIRDKANDPIKLNYRNFTTKDVLSQVLAVNFPNVENEAFEALKVEYKEFIDQYVQNAVQCAEIKNAIDALFARCLEGQARDKWASKISLILRKAPEAMVREEMPDYVPEVDAAADQRWASSLKEKKFLILQDVLGTNIGCNTGMNMKLDLVLFGRTRYLGIQIPDISALSKVAKVKMKFKMDRVEEMGKIYPAGTEAYTQTIQVGAQRLKAPFSLLGDYTRTPYIDYGKPGIAANKPLQIAKNLFEGGQPDRVDGVYGPVPVKEHLTVKSYVQAVHESLDDKDFSMIRKSLPDATVDYLIYAELGGETTFFDANGKAKKALTALFLDSIGEITIKDAVKRTFFHDLISLVRAEREDEELEGLLKNAEGKTFDEIMNAY